MRGIKLTMIGLLVITLASCAYRITTVEYNDQVGIKKKDVFYTLGRVLLEAEITYEKKVTTKYKFGIASKEPPVFLVKNVKIAPKLVNDGKVLIAKGKNISHTFFLQENIDFQFKNNGNLLSVTTDLVDESPQFIEDVTSSFSNIVKATAPAGTDQEEFLNQLQVSIQVAYEKYTGFITKGNDKNIKKSKEELDLLIQLLDNYLKNNRVEEVVSEIKFKQLIDPDKVPWDTNNQKSITFGPDSNPLGLPTITLIIDGPASKEILSFNDLIGDDSAAVSGLVYRIPAELPVRIKTSIDNTTLVISEEIIQFPQYGSFASIPVMSKVFSKRKTELVFDGTNGTLKQYKIEAQSSSGNIGKSLKASTKTIQETLDYLTFDLKIKELENAKKVKELNESMAVKEVSQLDSLKNSLELNKLKQQIEEINNSELTELEKLKQELEILKLKMEIEKLKN